ncbi:MAG: type II secretion system protein [Cetobacterium sp.]
MKRKNGFSVIEIILVLGVIGILSSFIVPKVRDYLAMAKDSKAINTIQNLRLASETYYLEKGSYPWSDKDQSEISDILNNLQNYTGNKIQNPGAGKDLLLEIGGSKDEPEGSIVYGGQIKVDIDKNKNDFYFYPEKPVLEFNIRGEKWEDI